MAANSQIIDRVVGKVSDLTIRDTGRVEGKSSFECLPNEVLQMMPMPRKDLFSMVRKLLPLAST